MLDVLLTLPPPFFGVDGYCISNVVDGSLSVFSSGAMDCKSAQECSNLCNVRSECIGFSFEKLVDIDKPAGYCSLHPRNFEAMKVSGASFGAFCCVLFVPFVVVPFVVVPLVVPLVVPCCVTRRFSSPLVHL